MSRETFAERATLSALAARRELRGFVGRFGAHPFLRWRFALGRADRLLIAPQDLRTADPTRASEIYSGRFAFAGKVVVCDSRSPFEMDPPSDEWAEVLHGFGWLRHLRAADSGITRANARALVDDWISLQSTWNTVSWRPDIVARRIMSWLSQAPLVLTEAELRFYRRFLRSLTRQVRYLRQTFMTTRDGLPRLQAIVALTCASLCMEGQARLTRPFTRRLVDELERQVLPDGGHISRNPGALIELLLDLLPLRQAYSARNLPPPPGLLNAIDRMMPMLRFFRHGDGSFALFNGMGPTPPDLLATVLAYDDARGAPVANAPHSGYQRIQADNMLVLMDTGAPPPVMLSQDAHAGCLSFELSSGPNRIVVNCGLPATNRDSWRQVARATAAHSTVAYAESSSCRFIANDGLRRALGTLIVGAPHEVKVTRQDREKAISLRATHDGYAESFGVVLQRTLKIASTGDRLDGEDAFVPAHGDRLPANRPDQFAVRFHLHPSVKANRLTDGHGVMLMLPNREFWTFTSVEDRVELEESVYLAGTDGPRRTTQIVVYGQARKVGRVRWTFAHIEPTEQSAKRATGEDPELPL